MKKILFAASECVPFIKTGGLADVCGALPKTFDHKDWDVRVVIPNYSCIPEKYRSQFEYVTHFYMACGSYIPSKYVGVLQYKLDGVTYYFIDNQEYFNCFVPYGDMRYDIEKFTFFDKAVLSMLPLIGFRPDIIHCHDWQAGLIPVYLKNEFQADSFFWGIRSIMTIHNLKFQGIWDVKTMKGLTGFSSDLFVPDKLEFNKDANMLKGGLVYADYITTVSPTYANEITTVEGGEGLSGLMTARKDRLYGILNGIDYEEYILEITAQDANLKNMGLEKAVQTILAVRFGNVKCVDKADITGIINTIRQVRSYALKKARGLKKLIVCLI